MPQLERNCHAEPPRNSCCRGRKGDGGLFHIPARSRVAIRTLNDRYAEIIGSKLDDRIIERSIGPLGPIRLIQSQLSFSIVFIGTVTLKTPVREDWPNIPVEIDGLTRLTDNWEGNETQYN